MTGANLPLAVEPLSWMRSPGWKFSELSRYTQTPAVPSWTTRPCSTASVTTPRSSTGMPLLLSFGDISRMAFAVRGDCAAAPEIQAGAKQVSTIHAAGRRVVRRDVFDGRHICSPPSIMRGDAFAKDEGRYGTDVPYRYPPVMPSQILTFGRLIW